MSARDNGFGARRTCALDATGNGNCWQQMAIAKLIRGGSRQILTVEAVISNIAFAPLLRRTFAVCSHIVRTTSSRWPLPPPPEVNKWPAPTSTTTSTNIAAVQIQMSQMEAHTIAYCSSTRCAPNAIAPRSRPHSCTSLRPPSIGHIIRMFIGARSWPMRPNWTRPEYKCGSKIGAPSFANAPNSSNNKCTRPLARRHHQFCTSNILKQPADRTI